MIEQPIDPWTLKLEALVLSIAETAHKHQKRYYFGGGFAIDLTFGGLSRPHGDVDFYPLEEDTEWWKDWFRSQGYVLYKEKDMENLPNAFSILTEDQVYVAEIYPIARGSHGEISMLVSEGTHDKWDELLTIQGNRGLWQGKSWNVVRAVTYKGQAIVVENYHTVLHELEDYRKRHPQEAYLEKHLHDFERAGITPHLHRAPSNGRRTLRQAHDLARRCLHAHLVAGTGGGPCSPHEAPQAPSLWPGELSDTQEAGAAMQLTKPFQGDATPNHQLRGGADPVHPPD